MDIIQSLKWRYAVKSFDKDYRVPSEKVATLKEAFNLTATSFGLQPLKLLVIKDRKTRERLLPYSMGQEKVVIASHLLVICVDKSFGIADVEQHFDRIKSIRKTTDEVLNPFKEYLLGYFKKTAKEDLHLSAIKQAYIALGNLMTVCAVEGIDACPMEGFQPVGYDEVLDLDSRNLTSVLLLPIGKRADDDFMAKLEKVRKPLSDVIIEI